MAGAKRKAERRALTPGEIALARTVFGDAIDYDHAKIVNRKWAFFQPKNVTMAPLGTIHFNPASGLYRDDFTDAPLHLQGLFIHEMVHVWQHQQGIFLPIARHPFCRYEYNIDPGRPFHRYGIEQQAEIVRHAFLKQRGVITLDKDLHANAEVALPF
ncbi:MAG: vgr related protein [Sphingomonas sp.]|nr:vgr related protein [Sphingomonas sp.]